MEEVLKGKALPARVTASGLRIRGKTGQSIIVLIMYCLKIHQQIHSTDNYPAPTGEFEIMMPVDKKIPTDDKRPIAVVKTRRKMIPAKQKMPPAANYGVAGVAIRAANMELAQASQHYETCVHLRK